MHDDDPGTRQRGCPRTGFRPDPAPFGGQPGLGRKRLSRSLGQSTWPACRYPDARDLRSPRDRGRLHWLIRMAAIAARGRPGWSSNPVVPVRGEAGRIQLEFGERIRHKWKLPYVLGAQPGRKDCVPFSFCLSSCRERVCLAFRDLVSDQGRHGGRHGCMNHQESMIETIETLPVCTVTESVSPCAATGWIQRRACSQDRMRAASSGPQSS